MGTSTDTVIETGLDARTAGTEYLSAHTAYSATGANEVSGGSYARQLMGWDAAASRIADNTDAESVPIPASTTVRWLGRWSAATVGTFYGMVPNGSTAAHVCVGLDTDTIYAPAHGFAANDTVVFVEIDGSVPTGLVAGTVYYVRASPGADTFTVAATLGGAAVNITASKAAIVFDIIEETFAAAGTLELAAGAFDLIGYA
jgi:hypothetical protein